MCRRKPIDRFLAEQAEQAERDAIEQEEKYWKGVKEVIDSRNIAGYKIPDTIIINKDGKKISVTPDDFFKYIYQIDKNGKSTFEKNDTVESSNNKNTQRDEESKKIENTVSSTPSLSNAKEELSKNGNLNKLFLQNLM